MRNVILILLIIIITGCDGLYKREKVIKHQKFGLDVITCYENINGVKNCYGTDLGLYVEYNNQRIAIEEALKLNIVDLEEIRKIYNQYGYDILHD